MLEALFHPAVLQWFTETFKEPTPPQRAAWPVIAQGEDILLLSPTGSGKTLAAFLYALDWLFRQGEKGRPPAGVAVLYISPLKALNNDIHYNLEAPLKGIQQRAQEMGFSLPLLTRGLRTGDTPPSQRRKMVTSPPQILMTTPESLFLMLSSKAQQMLKQVKFLIVDEIHTLFPNKRGAHLSLSLARLEHLTGSSVQRIGLSATMAPLEEVAAFFKGRRYDSPVQILDTGPGEALELKILLPVEDFTLLPEKNIWPPIYRLLLTLIQGSGTTLIFVNSRRLAERITININRLAGRPVAGTHHGSISREVRFQVEDLLRRGDVSCIVATSSLELGIDVGFIEQVIQIESPKEVTRGLQRVGRAGHTLHQKSKGRLIPKNRADLLEGAVIFSEMKRGRVEEASPPKNPLDVLAQHLVAMTATTSWQVEDLYQLIIQSYSFSTLFREDLESVLAMLAGQYEIRGVLDLRPRLYWDRTRDLVSANSYGKGLVYTGGGTIPDRGYFRVQLGEGGVILGELDEEFVYERRVGDTFLLGTSPWRIEAIKNDVVMVSKSLQGEALTPFWRAQQEGRPFSLGRRVGEFLWECEKYLNEENEAALIIWLMEECSLEKEGALALSCYLQEGKRALGALPTHSHLVVEEFLDALGDKRVLLHSPYGYRLHLLLSFLFKADLEDLLGLVVTVLPSDDGLLFHLPGETSFPGFSWKALQDNLEEKTAHLISSSALFGMTFRHCAQCSLVLPRGDFRRRHPLYLSRLKAKALLDRVKEYPHFPLIKETYREILQDYFPVKEARELIQAVVRGEITITHVKRRQPSPFAASHLFNFRGGFLYADDTPPGGGRRGENKTIWRGKEGQNYRQVLSTDVIQGVVQRIRGLHRKTLTIESFLHFLQVNGDLLFTEIPLLFPNQEEEVNQFLTLLLQEKRVVTIKGDHEPFLIPSSKVPLYQGVFSRRQIDGDYPPPHPFNQALSLLIGQYIRTHGPFTTGELAERYHLPLHVVEKELTLFMEKGVLTKGAFLPEKEGEEWCDGGLFQELHQRSLALRRRGILPQTRREYTRFLASWHGIGQGDELSAVLHRLQGLPLPAYLWEGAIFPSRIPTYSPQDLDGLLLRGQFSWQMQGTASSILLSFTPLVNDFKGGEGLQDLLGQYKRGVPKKDLHLSPGAERVQGLLKEKGALTLSQLLVDLRLPTYQLFLYLEELLLSSLITNDTFGPVRYLLSTPGKNRQGSRGVLSPSVLATMGRWSLLPSSMEEDLLVSIWTLLSRYGLISHSILKREGERWGDFSPLLHGLEYIGELQQGYLVEGLGGIQFAPSGVMESMQQKGETPPPYLVLPWEDPANPLPLFPEREGEGDWVVLQDGEPLLLARGRELSITPCRNLPPDELQQAIVALIKILRPFYRGEKLVVKEFQGIDVLKSPLLEVLLEIGFERVYQTLTLWPSVPLGKKD